MKKRDVEFVLSVRNYDRNLGCGVHRAWYGSGPSENAHDDRVMTGCDELCLGFV